MSDDAAVEAVAGTLLEQGLRNLWYPIAPSWQVGENPLGVTRLGDRIVVWRDRDGAVHALEDRCPHRGARLSLGWNLGDRLACWYHGVEIDAGGTVLDVPAVDSCPLTGKTAVRRYPCREVRGAIFAWFGDALHQEPAELDLPEQLTDDRYATMLCVATWGCNYRYAIDNVMDPMHGTYLHAQSHSMAQGIDGRACEWSRPRPDSSARRRTSATSTSTGSSSAPPAATGCASRSPTARSAGPGGPFGIVGFVTPVDRETCQVYFWRVRRVEGWERDLWRFLYRTRLESLHWDVLEQDRLVLEAMAGDAREHELLYQHDTGLVRVRRFMGKEAERQAAALAGSGARADGRPAPDSGRNAGRRGADRRGRGVFRAKTAVPPAPERRARVQPVARRAARKQG